MIDGLTGDLLWSKDNIGGETMYAYVSAAVGDLDGDGIPEICVPGSLSMVVCADPSGNLVWSVDSPTGDIWTSGTLALGDMDGDGKGEVVAGTHVFGYDGTLRGVAPSVAPSPSSITTATCCGRT